MTQTLLESDESEDDIIITTIFTITQQAKKEMQKYHYSAMGIALLYLVILITLIWIIAAIYTLYRIHQNIVKDVNRKEYGIHIIHLEKY